MSNLQYENKVTKTLAPQRKFIDDLVSGSISIIGSKELYLDKTSGEKKAPSDDKYNERWAKATYFDTFNPTINGLVGLIFKKPIVYSEDIPSQLYDTIENADMQGNHLDIIIEKYFKKALQKGISFIMIDMPKGKLDEDGNKATLTLADEKSMGIRPYLTIIEAENVTSWKTEVIGGQLVLSQVKIREFVEVDDEDNIYATKQVERYRILTRGSFKVYEVNKGSNDKLVDSGNTGLNLIPLVPLNLNETGFFSATPPFYELGKLSIRHYNVLTDSGWSAFTASVPFYFASGISKDDMKDVVISPNTMIRTDEPQADIKIVDYDGKGVAVNETLLSKYEMKMREFSLSVISTNRDLTATEVEIASNQSQSKLHGYTRALTDSMELILLISSMYYNKSDGGSIKIDADILSKPLTHEDITTINNMVMSGNLSQDTMWSILQSETFRMPSDFDAKKEKELIGSQMLLDDGSRE